MKAIRLVALITLGFLGIGAIVGAIPMIADPSGGLMRLPPGLLEHTPFRSFLIPGLILLFSNGLLSAAVFVAAMRRKRGYEMLVAIQGCVIAGWITVEVILIRAVAWPHFVYWGVGLVLIGCGLALRRDRRVANRLFAVR